MTYGTQWGKTLQFSFANNIYPPLFVLYKLDYSTANTLCSLNTFITLHSKRKSAHLDVILTFYGKRTSHSLSWQRNTDWTQILERVPDHTFPTSIHTSIRSTPALPSSLPHHADLGHLSLQLGSRHVLKVVVIAALSAPRVRLHDEVLHVQRSSRDPRRVRCLAHRRAELGGCVVSAGLLGQGRGIVRKVLSHSCK